MSGPQRLLTKLFKQELKENFELADLPIRDIFLKNKEDTILALHLYQESRLVGSKLEEMVKNYSELEFVVLFIQRGNLNVRKNIYSTTLHEGDQILLFGRKSVIYEIFKHDLRLMEEELKNISVHEM